MLFALFVVILVVGCIALCYVNRVYSEGWHILGTMLVVLGIMSVVTSLMVMCVNYSGAEARAAEYKETYKALSYKLDSETCRDEFGLLNKEIVDEIQAWNEDIAYRQKTQNNLWIGIYIPDIYDQLETVEYK